MNMNQKKSSVFTLLTVLIIGILIGVRIGRADISIPAVFVPAAETSEQAASQTAPPGLTDPGLVNTMQPVGSDAIVSETSVPDENGQYHSKDDVARYLAVYGHLPFNYVSKKQHMMRAGTAVLWSICSLAAASAAMYSGTVRACFRMPPEENTMNAMLIL